MKRVSWILRLSTTREEADLVLDRLWAHGATGVADEAHGDLVSVIAGFSAEATAREAAASLPGNQPVVEQHVAAWAGPQEATHEVSGREIIVASGHAFGHGHHPTTSLLLQWLSELELVNQSVLDVGTGTGILALAARANGASPVIGIDNDPEAIEAATLNRRRNDLWFELSSTPVRAIDQPCDVVLSNMLLPHQLSAAPNLVRLTAKTLLISGILGSQVDTLVAALDPLTLVETRSHDDWRALRLEKP